jgi:hypothetical protein
MRETATSGAYLKTETYGYSEMGYLISMTASGASNSSASYVRDLLGRVTYYVEYNGGVLSHERQGKVLGTLGKVLGTLY